ncbi:STAS domain-containing protein [Streptomyces sp. NPDC058701]|uniref:STAS domain-containing protein n=1 Tax=Streptomyces sp. NPDC058701 TaxID=3346608 RepID=UPI003662DC12
MSDAKAAKAIAAQIASYLAAVHPDEPDPDDLAWAIIHTLKQAGLYGHTDYSGRSDTNEPGEQHVLALPDQDDGVRVIVCVGQFDQQTLGPFGEAGAKATADPTIRRIVLDVSRITFADSSMLNEMFRLRRNTDLILVGPLPPSLERVLELIQARALFPAAESIQTARTL